MRPLIDRFMAKVQKTEECWIWKGAITGNNYGCIKVNKKSRAAHRVSWDLFRFEAPSSTLVLHKCDNTHCVNPDHLFLGNQSDNMQDMLSKGRSNYAVGNRARHSKLIPSQVLEIRKRSSEDIVSLAKEYEVTIASIRAVINRKVWKHL